MADNYSDNTPEQGEKSYTQSMYKYAARARTHVVTTGESLRKIALEYYGDAKKWRVIYEANLSRIIDPKKIKVGQKFIIPHLGF